MSKSLFLKLFIFFLIFSILPTWWIGQSALKDAMEANATPLEIIKGVGTGVRAISDKALEQLGQKMIENIGYTVAKQCDLYFDLHPRLLKDSFPGDRKIFAKDKVFRAIAMQPVGTKGFTVIYENDGRTWIHLNPKVEAGFDLHAYQRSHPAFWNIIDRSCKGENYGDYYTFPDPDGISKGKYMFCVVIGKTPFRLASTTFTEEFNQPMREVNEQVLTLTSAISKETKLAYEKKGTKNTIVFIITVCFLLSMLGIFLLARDVNITLEALAVAADKLSKGDFKLEINEELKNKPDNLGKIAKAMEKIAVSMQTSK